MAGTWQQVASGSITTSWDLNSIAAAMLSSGSPADVSSIRLVMYDTAGWPDFSLQMMGGVRSGDNEITMSWPSRVANGQLASPDVVTPWWDGAISYALLSGGPITWILWRQIGPGILETTATNISSAAAQTAQQIRDTAAAAINTAAINPAAGKIPWLPIALGVGALILIWKEL